MGGKPGKSGPPGNLNAAKNGMHAWRRRRALPAEKHHVSVLVEEEENSLLAKRGGLANVEPEALGLIRDTGMALGLVLLGMEEARARGCIAVNANGQWDFMPGLQRIKGLLDTRRQNLIALGLEHRERDLLDPFRAEMVRQEREAEREERDRQHTDMQANGSGDGSDHVEA